MDYFAKAIDLLQKLIAIPSFSNEEDKVADLWMDWLRDNNVSEVKRFHNNVYAISTYFDSEKPVLLLNSHMDTVRPVSSYTRNPFEPSIQDGRLFGLGSNDAGASGVTLAQTFLKFKDKKHLPFNILFAITAGEESMGEWGMRSFLPYLKEIKLYPNMAIVGEPTGCEAAMAEKGLVVCDATVDGKAGHAARDIGVNAIYRACEDIERIRNFKWPKTSDILGPIKISVTMIDAGTQHNIIPDKCLYVVDLRTTDAFTNEETVKLLQSASQWSIFTPRSTRIRASVLDPTHPLCETAKSIGIKRFISPTTSDMALMYDIPSIKLGPGKSERSHTANEYIELTELQQGLKVYEDFLIQLSRYI